MLKVKLSRQIKRVLFRSIFCSVLTVTSLLGVSVNSFGATAAQYNAIPPFLSTEVPPNVMFMLDNSGSMKNLLADGAGFDSSKTYYGIFEGTSKYKYEASIGIDARGYSTSITADAPYNVSVAATPGAFVEDNSCTTGLGNNCWDGSFLNWLVTRRIDAARKVLVGGKVEYRGDGYDYDGDGAKEWKVVANNEPSDRVKTQSYSGSQAYTPYPDGSPMTVYSPADSGAVHTTYDPYAKLKVKVPRVLLDRYNNVIGEYGTVADCGADAKADNWCKVTLDHDYTNPVVVAGPMTFEGSDPSVVRIKAVNATSDTFKIRIEEWEYKDGGHATEDISYIVLEAGAHQLTGGQTLSAGTVNVSATGTLSSDLTPVDISTAGFTKTPVVLASVTTDNDHDTVTTRQGSASSTSFQVALQEEKNGGVHATETVSYVALDKGDYSDGGGTSFQVDVKKDVDDKWKTISFTDTGVGPAFLAAMQTSDGPDPAALRYQELDSDSVEVFVEEEGSDGSTNEHRDEDVGYVVLSSTGTNEFNLALIVDEEPTGLLHDIADKVRLGISLYNYKLDKDFYNSEKFHGGTMKPKIPMNPFVKDAGKTTFRTVETYIDAGIDGIVDAIEHYPQVWGTTPLAENYYEVLRYYQQKTPYYESINGVTAGDYYEVSNTWDPYYHDGAYVPCAQSYILVFTDGEPYRDYYMPGYNSGSDDYSAAVGGSVDYDVDSNAKDISTTDDIKGGGDALDDLAMWAHSVVDQTTGEVTAERDLRTDSGLEGEQDIYTYTVGFGSDVVKQILRDTADNGGGIAYAAEDGRELKNQLTDAFTDILSRSSGTAASVISNTRSGEGAIYQSVFFPSVKDSNVSVSWIGQVHALLVDAYGNMREDTNDNFTLDLADDYFIVFNEDGTAVRYEDGDSNQKLEIDTATCPMTSGDCNDSVVDTVNLEDLHYLWNTSKWLNEFSDSAAETQRTSYISATDQRYIFTGVDANEDGYVDSTEIIDFTCGSVPSSSDLTDIAEFYPYLNLYSSFTDRPAEITSLSPANLTSFLQVQTKRQINYIRGSDCVDSSDPEDCNTEPLTIGGIDIPNTEMRSRKYDYDGDYAGVYDKDKVYDDNDLNLETWRLGDIVYSTPTLVGRPAENFHLLYQDTTYAPYVYKYKGRRQVVYAGANDGMIHAFNAGFYDSNNKRFCKANDFTDATTCQGGTQPDLGAELWAYVPFNLLPHLYWLTQSTYNEDTHVYYIDQKPRVFDAKIFTEESSCRSVPTGVLDQLDNAGCIHPNGWGTVMVIGMNLGGGSIIADMDKTDGNAPVTGVDKTMKSAFTIFDITNPEVAPTLLAELTMPKMGFSTSYPTVIAMRAGTENQWYLAFGSGPADVNGDPGTADATTGAYSSDIINDVKSLQAGQLYLLDLVKLAQDNEIFTLNSAGASTEVDFSDSTTAVYTAYDTNTFISAPVTADFDLDYNTDALYFGTISGTSKPWSGKLRRVAIDDEASPADWPGSSVMMDVQQPITAAPAIAQDDDGKNWVFFGTGRYSNAADKSDTNQQTFYGLKEHLTNGAKDWSTLVAGDLVDVTSYEVFSDKYVSDSSSNDWNSLLTDQNAKDGWLVNFSSGTGERNLGQAALIGGLLSFTTFIPESDICSAGGESFLWGLYYKTGTAHYSGVLGTTTNGDSDGSGTVRQQATREVSLGKGLATSPGIHVGRKSGTSVFVQSSTGEIIRIEEENPLSPKSGMNSWKLLQ